MRTRTVALLFTVALVGTSLFAAPSLAAFNTAETPITGSVDFITGFTGSAVCNASPEPRLEGPIGLLEGPNNWFVGDTCNGTLYRFPAGGGPVSSAVAAKNGITTGMVLSNDHAHYYGLTNSFSNHPALVEFDPGTLAITRTVASMVFGATVCYPLGVTTDPSSSDLYVSGLNCGIFRIANPDTASPTVTTAYTYPSGFNFVDGLLWSSDGSTLFGANGDSNFVMTFSRGTTLTPGARFVVNRPDGLVFAPPSAGAIAGMLFVNGNDGVVTMINPSTGAETQVATGGSRGDFALLGLDGCVYVTQSDRVSKLLPCPLAAAALVSAPQPVATLPQTGVNARRLLAFGLILILLGALAISAGRRREVRVWWRVPISRGGVADLFPEAP